jgi:hypothetical protein
MSLPGRRVSAGYTLTKLLCNNHGAYSEKPLLLLKKRSHFQTHKESWIEHKLDHGSQWGTKSRMTVLAKAISSLLDWTGLDYFFPELLL